MSDLLADTHAIVWFLLEPSRLSSAADAALSNAIHSGQVIQVSAITLVELVYLTERGKLPLAAWTGLLAALHDPAISVALLPVDEAVAQAVERIPRSIVPDMPDRIIGATALIHGRLPLVTADRKLQAVPLLTIIW